MLVQDKWHWINTDNQSLSGSKTNHQKIKERASTWRDIRIVFQCISLPTTQSPGSVLCSKTCKICLFKYILGSAVGQPSKRLIVMISSKRILHQNASLDLKPQLRAKLTHNHVLDLDMLVFQCTTQCNPSNQWVGRRRSSSLPGKTRSCSFLLMTTKPFTPLQRETTPKRIPISGWPMRRSSSSSSPAIQTSRSSTWPHSQLSTNLTID